MGAKTGEIARETAAYRCSDCHKQMNVSEGRLIPQCPNCGSDSFQTGWRTLQNQPTMERFAAAL